MAPTEAYEEAGLFDPIVDTGTGRLELLDWLAGLGFSVEQMVGALQNNNLGALASDHRILSTERVSIDDAIKIAGLSAADLAKFAQAFGFIQAGMVSPESLSLTESEAQALGVFGAIGTMFSEEESLAFVRVVGSSMARIGEAAVLLFLTDIESPHLASGGSEYDLAVQMFSAVGLLDEFAPLLDTVIRRHIWQSVERTRIAMSDDQRRMLRYAVGFIDLVGFTPISRNMSPAELGTFIRDFEGRAHDAVTEAGARLVKVIGDEVMFVSPDVDSACQVARSLMTGFHTATEGHVLPRGGLAYGDVLMQGGDYYGEVVNMASRLADTAVPRELLVTEALGDAAKTFEFEPAGRRQLKGFAEPVTVRSMLFAD